MQKLKKAILKYFPLHYYKSYRSYSQDGEDMILKSFYESLKGYKGFFVDVGAHHPVRYSNTYFFYKKGWKGINIEPTPTAIKAFNILRKRDINLNVGIASQTGLLTFYCFNEPALNSFSKEAALKVESSGKYQITNKIDINVRPLKDILNEHVPKGIKIDFMSVDVEGMDLDVLESNDWEKFSPDYLLVEGHVDIDQLSNYDVYKFLTAKRYKIVAKTFRTLIFKLS